MFRLNEQAQAILAALKALPELAEVVWLDDDSMLAAAPGRLPVAWLTLEELRLSGEGVPPGKARITWTVLFKTKSRRETDAGRPLLTIADAIVNRLHGLRGPEVWARPLGFNELKCLELQSEASCYALRFTTWIYQMQQPRPTGGIITTTAKEQ